MGILATGSRVLAVSSVIVLSGVMVRLALRPDWPATRLQVLALTMVVGFGWVGGLGVITNRFYAIAIGATGLFLIGFWQAVLWMIMLPTAILLIIAGVAAGSTQSDNNASTV